MITFAEFKKYASKGNVVPVWHRIPADLDTPVSAYMKYAARKKHPFLLESIEGGEKLARYSFIGCDPFLTVDATGLEIEVQEGRRRQQFVDDPLDYISRLLAQYRPVRIPDLPRFTGGGVGYFSYDTIRLMEEIPDNNPNDIGLPDIRFSFYDSIVAFDHLKQEIILIVNVILEDAKPKLKSAYLGAVERLMRMSKSLERSSARPKPPKRIAKSKTLAHCKQSEFERMVRRAKKYIKEGDIFQVVLSQRWEIRTSRSALDVYRRLRRLNPSPYMFLLDYGDDAVVGSSPEMMVRIEGDIIETRPIAGTRPRGIDEREDQKQIDDLLRDEKELAEHTMLLDLGRNDIGRVSEPGTVEVREKMNIEKYSHVIHIVSSVVGRLSQSESPVDGHFSCFPAGTVSGAPKIRAMQIIDELESERRGIYAGSIAYLDFFGNLDSCIAIRTVVKKGKSYFVQAGAGIVADSQPKTEFQETEAKARALIEAVGGADE